MLVFYGKKGFALIRNPDPIWPLSFSRNKSWRAILRQFCVPKLTCCYFTKTISIRFHLQVILCTHRESEYTLGMEIIVRTAWTNFIRSQNSNKIWIFRVEWITLLQSGSNLTLFDFHGKKGRKLFRPISTRVLGTYLSFYFITHLKFILISPHRSISFVLQLDSKIHFSLFDKSKDTNLPQYTGHGIVVEISFESKGKNDQSGWLLEFGVVHRFDLCFSCHNFPARGAGKVC